MRNLIAVAFVEPVTEGLEFPRDQWPLHITLVKFDLVKFDVVKFDVVEPRGKAGAESRAGAEPDSPPASGDPVAERVAAAMAGPVAAALGCRVEVGGEAGFGRGGSTRVNLIEPNGRLQAFHNQLVRVVEELPGRISTPAFTLAGYRPHVSHRGHKRLRQGDVVALDRIALVDMAPDGGHATRRILRLWAEGAA